MQTSTTATTVEDLLLPQPAGWWRVRWPDGVAVTYFRDRDEALELQRRLRVPGVVRWAEEIG